MSSEKDSSKKSISRRTFIKSATVGSVGVAAAGILPACSPRQATETVVSPDESGAPVVNENLCEDWLGKAPGITDDQCDSTLSADVVIVGSGVAGISAARAAREAGASVLVVEQSDGITVRGLCFGAVDSTLQKELGCTYDHMEIVREMQKYSGNRSNMSLMKKWADESGAAFDWFEEVLKEDGRDFGYYLAMWPNPEAFDNSTEYYKQYCTSIQFTDWVGAVEAQYNKAVALGATFEFNMKAKELVVVDGAVKGVYAENSEGKLVKVEAVKGVILATGDYGHNEAMLKELCPEFYLACGPTMIETSNGDGHKMAIWAGGMMEPGPHAHMSHAFAGGFSGLGATAALQLNKFGKRFMNEDVPGQSYTNQIIRQPGAFGWQIWDSNWEDMVMHQSIGHGNIDVALLDEEALQGYRDRFAAALNPDPEKPSMLLAANTLEELLEKMELPKETALAEIARYNELCKKGSDDDFGKRADRMYPVETGPFFASKSFVAAGVITAGVVVDATLKVLDDSYNPIPGLWAIGNVAGGRYGVDYPTNCPATSHGTAVTFGRSAGTDAANA